jgi:micrococcal nuclease
MYEYKATVLKVVDGDTLDLRVSLGFHSYLDIRVRLAYIDTEELNSSDAVLKEQAVKAKNRVLELTTNPTCIVKSSKPYKTDRYGRWVVELVNSEGQNVNRLLLAEGLAKFYHE